MIEAIAHGLVQIMLQEFKLNADEITRAVALGHDTGPVMDRGRARTVRRVIDILTRWQQRDEAMINAAIEAMNRERE